MNRIRGARSVQVARFYSNKVSPDALFLNPHAWQGLPADQIFELQNLRKKYMGDAYSPNDEERTAVLSTISALANNPKIGYAFEIDNFKERYMNNTPMKERGLPQKLSNQYVINKGSLPHEKRRIEHLNRICAYEMPLLAKYRQPYTPRPRTEAPIKLTYQTDFSNETNNKFNRRVLLSVELANLNLEPAQLHKFKVLAGDKLNTENDTFYLSSDKYREAAQNVNWLVDTFNKLLTEAKDLTEDFADIPVNTLPLKRTARKAEPKFPETWSRPQDAPIGKFGIVDKLVETVKQKADEKFLNQIKP